MDRYDLFSRYQRTPDGKHNATIGCDAEPFESLDEALLEEVEYERPAFNWPKGNSPDGNVFSIHSMAIGVLKDKGYWRQAEQLSFKLRSDTPKYDDLAALLWRHLDFQPISIKKPEKYKALKEAAEECGADFESLDKASGGPANLFKAKSNMGTAQAWDFLEANAGKRNCFGETAACQLSNETVEKLLCEWIPQLDAAAPMAEPFEKGTLRWFSNLYPMGFSHLNKLHQTRQFSATMGYGLHLALAYFEQSRLAGLGMDATDSCRIGIDHLDLSGVRGSAILGMKAFDILPTALCGGPLAIGSAAKAMLASLARSGAGTGMSEPEMLLLAHASTDPAACLELRELLVKEAKAKAASARMKSSDLDGRIGSIYDSAALLKELANKRSEAAPPSSAAEKVKKSPRL